VQVSHEATSSLQGPVYCRREPESGKLYEVIRDNPQTLCAAIEDGFASPLPRSCATNSSATSTALLIPRRRQSMSDNRRKLCSGSRILALSDICGQSRSQRAPAAALSHSTEPPGFSTAEGRLSRNCQAPLFLLPTHPLRKAEGKAVMCASRFRLADHSEPRRSDRIQNDQIAQKLRDLEANERGSKCSTLLRLSSPGPQKRSEIKAEATGI